jgi:hypothetical protein
VSTSVTKESWEIVVYHQKELLTELHWWAVEVWENFDLLGSDNPSRAKRLSSYDNFDWEKYKLTEDTLETLLGKTAEFIKGEQK